MASKRFHLARLLVGTGFREPRIGAAPASLLVFNYHRLRPSTAASTDFDDGVFGPAADEFRKQMEWLRTSTTILDESGLLELSVGQVRDRGRVFAAITFDDAYVDCYTLARPILNELGIRGIFFVPVDMIETRELGWWDQAAYLLKKTSKQKIAIGNDVLDLKSGFDLSLRRILNLFKLRPANKTAGLLREISQACDVALPDRDVQSSQLMTWDQLREMRSSGHGIGSHTFSHRVLATLPPEEQEREIRASRRELEARIGTEVHSFAYPVGGPQHIDRYSVALARDAGYRQAFTFNTGIAELPIRDRFLIPRESAHSFEELRVKTLMPGLMGLRDKRAFPT